MTCISFLQHGQFVCTAGYCTASGAGTRRARTRVQSRPLISAANQADPFSGVVFFCFRAKRADRAECRRLAGRDGPGEVGLLCRECRAAS